MAQLKKSGQNFVVEGRSISLFGLQGVPTGKNWAVGINWGSAEEPSYILTEVSPAPALEEVVAVIEQDKANGNLDKIARVAMSNRMAVRLFLDGTIKPTDFDHVDEATMDTSTFVEGGASVPVINLEGVQLGAYTLPVAILSEMNVGSSALATLTEDGTIV